MNTNVLMASDIVFIVPLFWYLNHHTTTTHTHVHERRHAIFSVMHASSFSLRKSLFFADYFIWCRDYDSMHRISCCGHQAEGSGLNWGMRCMRWCRQAGWPKRKASNGFAFTRLSQACIQRTCYWVASYSFDCQITCTKPEYDLLQGRFFKWEIDFPLDFYDWVDVDACETIQ